MSEFEITDSGQRQEYESGMRRDKEDGKPNYLLILDGPMLDRWAEHLTKGAVKYGAHNWQKACTPEELERFRRSAFRHFLKWLNGEREEDHAAAVIFNVNAAEAVGDHLASESVAERAREQRLREVM